MGSEEEQIAAKMVKERLRQEETLGYTPEHDKQHDLAGRARLIGWYAAKGEWIKVGALAIAWQQTPPDEPAA
jgi:hypothetical protein